MSDKPKILIYRNFILPVSETFVYNQSVKLDRYEAFFLGAKPADGLSLDLPSDHVYLINQGGVIGWIREAVFKLFGFAPNDVYKWIGKLDPELVHAHFGPDGAVVMRLTKRLNKPLLVSFHGTDATLKDEYVKHSYLMHRLYLIRRSRLGELSDFLIAQSEYLAEKLRHQHSLPKEKIVIVRHGIELDVFNADNQTEWGHILFVGRLIELKGLHLLIKALRLVREKNAGVHLTVIGDGPERDRCEKLAERELERGYIFLGAQPHDVVLDYFKKAYIFSMPSITMPSGEAESLGIVFLEAQAMRVPVVSFNSGGISEVLLHGETGFLAKEGDVDDLAKYLLVLLENPELQVRMGNAGRAWVEKVFDLREKNAELESLYDAVLEKKMRDGT